MKWLIAVIACAPALLSARADASRDLAELEARSGGRLGVAVRSASGEILLEHRGDERFALCSTFKVLLAAAVLARVDRGEERLDREIPFGESDLLAYAPVARENLARGSLSVAALCAAAVELSDNTAANLLLVTLGGPPGFTAVLRGWGDTVTRLDRNEPGLNEVKTGDPRDTTTPNAMSETLRQVLTGDVLASASRARLIGWMVASPTGRKRFRAGFPADWKSGDKTGTGPAGETNDVAFVHPPGAAPVLVAAYFQRADGDAAEREAVLADVGRIVAEMLADTPR